MLRAERDDALAGYDRMKAEAERRSVEVAQERDSALRMTDRAANAEAEVERLRAENEELSARLAACDPKAVRVEAGIWETDAQRWKALALKAEAENAALRKDLEWAQRSAHAQATDTRLDVLRNKNEALKARLEWFEEYAEVVHFHVTSQLRGVPGVDEVLKWENENPEPSEGT